MQAHGWAPVAPHPPLASQFMQSAGWFAFIRLSTPRMLVCRAQATAS